MIETGGVLPLMGLDAIAVGIGDDQDVAVTPHFVADRPALDLRPPRGDCDDVRGRSERAFPGAFPVRRRGASGEQQKWKKALHGLLI